jgi:hypothetical protein
MRRRVPNRGILSALAAVIVIGLAPSANAQVCGDANGDGRVSVSDGVQALRAAAGLPSVCDDDCDVDGNGSISVTDGVNILRKAAGLGIVEACPAGDPVASIIGNTVDLFGPLTKIGALGGAGAQSVTPTGTASPCDNPGGEFQETESGFQLDDCEIDGVSFTGFIAKGGGSLGFDGLSLARRGDVLSVVGTLNVDQVQGNSETSGFLQTDSLLVGSYSVLFQQVVSDGVGQTLGGELVFDTTQADLGDIAEIRVTLTGDRTLPVVITYDDQSTQSFMYDTDSETLTPVDDQPPVARVRLSNIDDRITAFLNGQQVLQAQSTGPNATQDTGFVQVDGLTCGDNLFEFVVENTLPGSGYTFRAELQVDGVVVAGRSCGQAGVQGCDDDNQTQGIVARDVTFVCVPCAPCTRGAGTCANPLNIQNRDRIQIHGRTSGTGNFTGGPCGSSPGPESVFRFTPPSTGCYEFSTCGTSFDSQLYIGDGLCPGQSGPFPEDCRDDDFPCADGTDRELTFTTLDAGQPITLIIEGEASQGAGYTFDVRPSGRCIL